MREAPRFSRLVLALFCALACFCISRPARAEELMCPREDAEGLFKAVASNKAAVQARELGPEHLAAVAKVEASVKKGEGLLERLDKKVSEAEKFAGWQMDEKSLKQMEARLEQVTARRDKVERILEQERAKLAQLTGEDALAGERGASRNPAQVARQSQADAHRPFYESGSYLHGSGVSEDKFNAVARENHITPEALARMANRCLP